MSSDTKIKSLRELLDGEDYEYMPPEERGKDLEFRLGSDHCYIALDMAYPVEEYQTLIYSAIKCHSKLLEDIFTYKVVSVPSALGEAKRQVEMAWQWFKDNGIRLTRKEQRESEKAAERFIRRIDRSFIICTGPPLFG